MTNFPLATYRGTKRREEGARELWPLIKYNQRFQLVAVIGWVGGVGICIFLPAHIGCNQRVSVHDLAGHYFFSNHWEVVQKKSNYIEAFLSNDIQVLPHARLSAFLL